MNLTKETKDRRDCEVAAVDETFKVMKLRTPECPQKTWSEYLQELEWILAYQLAVWT